LVVPGFNSEPIGIEITQKQQFKAILRVDPLNKFFH
jgi:hypothetical protein